MSTESSAEGPKSPRGLGTFNYKYLLYEHGFASVSSITTTFPEKYKDKNSSEVRSNRDKSD